VPLITEQPPEVTVHIPAKQSLLSPQAAAPLQRATVCSADITTQTPMWLQVSPTRQVVPRSVAAQVTAAPGTQ
jgi:hypothetical protein